MRGKEEHRLVSKEHNKKQTDEERRELWKSSSPAQTPPAFIYLSKFSEILGQCQTTLFMATQVWQSKSCPKAQINFEKQVFFLTVLRNFKLWNASCKSLVKVYHSFSFGFSCILVDVQYFVCFPCKITLKVFKSLQRALQWKTNILMKVNPTKTLLITCWNELQEDIHIKHLIFLMSIF